MMMMMMIPIKSTSACWACPMINTFLHEIDESHWLHIDMLLRTARTLDVDYHLSIHRSHHHHQTGLVNEDTSIIVSTDHLHDYQHTCVTETCPLFSHHHHLNLICLILYLASYPPTSRPIIMSWHIMSHVSLYLALGAPYLRLVWRGLCDHEWTPGRHRGDHMCGEVLRHTSDCWRTSADWDLRDVQDRSREGGHCQDGHTDHGPMRWWWWDDDVTAADEANTIIIIIVSIISTIVTMIMLSTIFIFSSITIIIIFLLSVYLTSKGRLSDLSWLLCCRLARWRFFQRRGWRGSHRDR